MKADGPVDVGQRDSRVQVFYNQADGRRELQGCQIRDGRLNVAKAANSCA